VLLKFPPLGRGPSGRFLVSEEIRFGDGIASPWRLDIDFGVAVVRYTTAASKFRYSAPQILGSSSVMPVSQWNVRGGAHQIGATIDCCFHWDFTYISSRTVSTGKAERMRIFGQDLNNAAHVATAPFKCSNTWFFDLNLVEYVGKRTAGLSAKALINQQGLCVVTRLNGVDLTNSDVVIIPGQAALVGVEGTFSSGTWGRGKALLQGANIAYFSRNDGGYGYTYQLYGEVGALVNGVAELLDSAGAVVGSFTITTVARYVQCAEAVSTSGQSTFVGVNWFARAISPNQAISRFLNWNLADCHVFYHEGIIDGVGMADVITGTGFNAICGSAGGKIAYNIDWGDQIQISNGNYTTGALGGVLFDLTNIIGGGVRDNTLMFFDQPGTTDNTVKDFTVDGNSGYQSGVFVNTGNRYNDANPRGIRFRNNGSLGVNVDQDDLRKRDWTPTITGSGGNPTTVTQGGAGYVLAMGRLTLTSKTTLTTVGAPAGDMRIALPAGLPAGIIEGMMVPVSVGNIIVPGFCLQSLGYIRVPDAGGGTNSVDHGFKQSDVLVPNGTAVHVNATLAVEYD
jgi:hypothetical protein